LYSGSRVVVFTHLPSNRRLEKSWCPSPARQMKSFSSKWASHRLWLYWPLKLSFCAILVLCHKQNQAVAKLALAGFIPPVVPLTTSGILSSWISRNTAGMNNTNGKQQQVTLSQTQQQQEQGPSKRIKLNIFHALGYDNLGVFGCIILATAAGISYMHFENIPNHHFLFAGLYPLYLGLINRFRFQRNLCARKMATRDSRVLAAPSMLFQGRGIWFNIYVNVFAVLGLLLPSIVCLAAPRDIAASAASHTMLLFSQVIVEIISTGPFMHSQPKLMVPIGFNAFRMATLWSWVTRSWDIAQQTLNSNNLPVRASMKVWVATAFLLGLVNLVIWTYNLFIFLLLRAVPQYWNTTIFPTNEIQWKIQLFPVADSESGTSKKKPSP